MTASTDTMFRAVVCGGIPADATRADLLWLERTHRWHADHARWPRSAWHARWAFLCAELLASREDSPP